METPERAKAAPDVIDTLLLLMLACSLCTGLAGGFVLLTPRTPTDPLQPYVSTAAERDVEKRAQEAALLATFVERKVEGLPVAMVDPFAVSRYPRMAPSPPGEPSQPSEARSESQRVAEQAGRSEKNTSSHPKSPATSWPSSRTAKPPSPDKPLPLALIGYVADQLAAIRIELRDLTSRVAVTEATTRQLQTDPGPWEWFARFSTALTILQSILGAVTLIVAMLRRRKQPARAG